MKPSKFDLMKDMDAVVREAERERARIAAFFNAGIRDRQNTPAARPAFSAARSLPTLNSTAFAS